MSETIYTFFNFRYFFTVNAFEVNKRKQFVYGPYTAWDYICLISFAITTDNIYIY